MQKRIQNAKKAISKKSLYDLESAISFFTDEYKENYSVKFNETIDCAINLGIDTKNPNQTIKGFVELPNRVGRENRVALIVEKSRIEEGLTSGAEEVGSEDLIQKIKNGFLDFEVCAATPPMMHKIVSLGKILGPKGLMPNPKMGTVSDRITSMIKEIKKRQIKFKSDKNGIVHSRIGKMQFTKEKIRANIIKMYNSVLEAKPTNFKSAFIKQFFLSSTHGPSLKLDLKSFVV